MRRATISFSRSLGFMEWVAEYWETMFILLRLSETSLSQTGQGSIHGL